MTSFVRNLTDLGIIVQVQPPFSAHTLHNDSRIIAFSRKYNHSPAQILLQWCLRQNFSCIALSSEEEHLQSNPNEPTFTLEEEDLHVSKKHTVD